MSARTTMRRRPCVGQKRVHRSMLAVAAAILMAPPYLTLLFATPSRQQRTATPTASRADSRRLAGPATMEGRKPRVAVNSLYGGSVGANFGPGSTYEHLGNVADPNWDGPRYSYQGLHLVFDFVNWHFSYWTDWGVRSHEGVMIGFWGCLICIAVGVYNTWKLFFTDEFDMSEDELRKQLRGGQGAYMTQLEFEATYQRKLKLREASGASDSAPTGTYDEERSRAIEVMDELKEATGAEARKAAARNEEEYLKRNKEKVRAGPGGSYVESNA